MGVFTRLARSMTPTVTRAMRGSWPAASSWERKRRVAIPVVKPEMTGWGRYLTKRPRRKRPNRICRTPAMAPARSIPSTP